jgi:hypothetical protein
MEEDGHRQEVFSDEKEWYFKNIYANAKKNCDSERFEPKGG